MLLIKIFGVLNKNNSIMKRQNAYALKTEDCTKLRFKPVNIRIFGFAL